MTITPDELKTRRAALDTLHDNAVAAQHEYETAQQKREELGKQLQELGFNMEGDLDAQLAALEEQILEAKAQVDTAANSLLIKVS